MVTELDLQRARQIVSSLAPLDDALAIAEQSTSDAPGRPAQSGHALPRSYITGSRPTSHLEVIGWQY